LWEATKEIKYFFKKPNPNEIQKIGKSKFEKGPTSTCNFVSTQSQDNIMTHWIDIENISFPRESFQWKRIHHGVNNFVKTI
jgi:hypothetical protein